MGDDPRRHDEPADRFDAYVEALLGPGRPSPASVADPEEAEMARLAAELAASSATPDATAPDPAFLEQVRRRMREADAGIAAVRERPSVEPAGRRPWRLSRRELLQAGIGAAAGLAAGAVGVSLRPADEAPRPTGASNTPLVAGRGYWTEVASAADVSEGSALRFSTAAFDGFVVNDGGEIRALSSVCTHMGCTLQFRPHQGDLRCPCHGASFDLQGRLANGRGRWRSEGAYAGDAEAYPVDLPDLFRPRVKVEDERIWVWTAQV